MVAMRTVMMVVMTVRAMMRPRVVMMMPVHARRRGAHAALGPAMAGPDAAADQPDLLDVKGGLNGTGRGNRTRKWHCLCTGGAK